MKDAPTIACTFCGRKLYEVHRMAYLNERASICDECVKLCQEMIHEEDQAEQEVAQRKAHQPTPIRPVL